MEIHRSALLVDGHNDLPWELREADGPGFKNIDLTKPQKKFHTDIERLKKGGVGAQFWSAWVPTSSGKKGGAAEVVGPGEDHPRKLELREAGELGEPGEGEGQRLRGVGGEADSDRESVRGRFAKIGPTQSEVSREHAVLQRRREGTRRCRPSLASGRTRALTPRLQKLFR